MQRVGNFSSWRRVLEHLDVEQDGIARDILLGSEIVPVVNMGVIQGQQWDGEIERLAGFGSADVVLRPMGQGVMLQLRTLYVLRQTGDTSLHLVMLQPIIGSVWEFILHVQGVTGRVAMDTWIPRDAGLFLRVTAGVSPPVASRWQFSLLGVEVR